jgi:hypothetical protein
MAKQESARERQARVEAELRALDPERYKSVDKWYDRELYGCLWGISGVQRSPAAHAPALVAVLTARRDVYESLATEVIQPMRHYERGRPATWRWHAEVVDNALRHLGDGTTLPVHAEWESFFPGTELPAETKPLESRSQRR